MPHSSFCYETEDKLINTKLAMVHLSMLALIAQIFFNNIVSFTLKREIFVKTNRRLISIFSCEDEPDIKSINSDG
ncbi:hypothetical protein P3T73_10375 [Kiritimatiellota bacterium B12222]|nr:hypothetical protein P3T73_10375 [Kiritimatiellota bacterium B12222]